MSGTFRDSERKNYEHFRKKRGTVESGKEGAHYGGYNMIKEMEKLSLGRPSKQTDKAYAAMHDDHNVRLVNKNTNRKDHERRDARIIKSAQSKEPLYEGTTARRAKTIYDHTLECGKRHDSKIVVDAAERVGNLKVANGRRGPNRYVKNM
eukprot:gb/GECG01011641.1/.p1 GENE.gb/GECG01011641.1/~~gb/GECG01011641.1/.p1  ORF type:complete len:150 (+),score=18.61 gb/GECG01011641.1/:1-450(+)